MFREAELHLEIRNLLQHLGFCEMAREPSGIVRGDGVTVELAMAVGQQARDRTVDLGAECVTVRRQLRTPLAPPAGRASPEQLLAAFGSLLHFEPFARQRGPRLAERGHESPPQRFAV